MSSLQHFARNLLAPSSKDGNNEGNFALTVTLVAHGGALFSIGISLLVLLGWLGNWPKLTHWAPVSTQMVPDTAIGVLVAGVSMWCLQRRRGRHISLAGGFLVLLGLVNLIATTQPALIHRIFLLSAYHFRMAQQSAMAFVLLGLGLLLLSRVKLSLPALWAVALFGNTVVIIGLISVLAYISGLNLAPWWGGFFLQMSLPTATSCAALGTTLICIFFQESKGTAFQFSVTAAVMSIIGLLLLFAGVDAAVLAGSSSLLNSRAVSRKATEQMRALQAMAEGVRQAESGQRGYLLTGERQYLEDFRRGQQMFAEAGGKKNAETAKLIATIKLKFDELAKTVELEQAARHTEAIALVKSSEGLRLMEQIDAQQKVIAALWQKKSAQRREESEQSILSIRQTVLWSYGMAVFFALGASVLIVAEMRRRSRIESELRESEVKINMELREQRMRAEEANRAKSNFLASMSHEIRTPMNAILGMADMLWETELSATQRHYVEIFRRAGGTLLTLINDILNLSKIESGSFSLERIDFDLAEMVEQLMEILTPKAEEKGVALSAHTEGVSSTSVLGDPVRLQQVLLNLLGNALKFTEKGSVALRIRSHCTDTHATFEFDVEDTGIGIPADKLSAIFEDFTQAESSITRRFGGTGLGLSISQRIVTLMGGQLRVSSELGKGSTFSFHVVLPINLEQHAAKSADLVEVAGKRVLIVDNNATNRAILGGMCSAWGMVTVTCGSGAEAIEMVKACPENEPFALALVDRLMPGMDGFDTAIELRAHRPKVAILIISSDSLPGDISRCRELGFCGHLLKPIRSAALLTQVMQALSGVTENKAMATANEKPADQTSNKETPDSAAIKVLAAEDSDDNRFLLEAYCTGTKYHLTFAFDGTLAVQAFQKGPFDLVLMDIQMPLMDGLTATRTIRAFEIGAHQKRTPILAMTANALPEDMAAAHEAGCDAHLAKPISKKSFLAALEQWQAGSASDSGSQTEITGSLSAPALRYLSAREKELALLHELLRRADFKELERLAHNLKGTGSSYGFPDITRLGSEMEQASKRGDAKILSRDIEDLTHCVEQARSATVGNGSRGV